MRVSSLAPTLGGIKVDPHGDHWLYLLGKGAKAGKVALPPLARIALDRYLVERGLPVTPARWDPHTPLIGSLGQGPAAGITGTRLWGVLRRFFVHAADLIQAAHPAAAEKCGRPAPIGGATLTQRARWRAARN